MKNILKEKRESVGLTQVQVSDRANIAERTYRYYELGEREPTVKIAKKIAKILGSTVDELF